jgi:hypothetical protein
MERRPHFGGRLLSVQLTVRVRGPVFILCSFSHNEVYVKYVGGAYVKSGFNSLNFETALDRAGT